MRASAQRMGMFHRAKSSIRLHICKFWFLVSIDCDCDCRMPTNGNSDTGLSFDKQFLFYLFPSFYKEPRIRLHFSS